MGRCRHGWEVAGGADGYGVCTRVHEGVGVVRRVWRVRDAGGGYMSVQNYARGYRRVQEGAGGSRRVQEGVGRYRMAQQEGTAGCGRAQKRQIPLR